MTATAHADYQGGDFNFAKELELQRWHIKEESLLEAWADEAGAAIARAIKRQYIKGRDVNDTRSPVRLSQIGKPAVQTACKLPSVKQQLIEAGLWIEDVPDERLTLIFLMGDIFEEWCGFTLKRYGYKILTPPLAKTSRDGQWKVSYKGVPGHLDYIVETPDTGEQYVVEVKTMSDYYFRKFTKCPDDDRGYVTQLATYTHDTGLPGRWVCLNKEKGIVKVVTPDQAQLDAALDRADRIIPRFEQVTDFESMLKVFRAPPGEPEVHRKKLTGRLRMPATMAFDPLRDLFYHVDADRNGYSKMTEYVGEFNVGEYDSLSDVDRLHYISECTEYKLAHEALPGTST